MEIVQWLKFINRYSVRAILLAFSALVVMVLNDIYNNQADVNTVVVKTVFPMGGVVLGLITELVGVNYLTKKMLSRGSL